MNEFCPACGGPSDFAGTKNGFDLGRCRSCRTVFVYNPPSTAELSAFYEGYKANRKYLRRRDAKVKRALGRLKHIPFTKGQRFLDVGCNAGFGVAAALQLGLDAYGIDIDRESIEAAKSWLPEDRFDVSSAEQYAASGKKADIIYSSEVIEHMIDPGSFVAALSRILEPGGRLYLTCPDAGHIRRPLRFTAWKEVKPPEHLVFFTRKGLRALFGRHGFEGLRFVPHLKPSHRMTAVAGPAAGKVQALRPRRDRKRRRGNSG